MNQHVSAAAIAADPNLSGPIERAARCAAGQFTMLAESAVVALMYPVKYVMSWWRSACPGYTS